SPTPACGSIERCYTHAGGGSLTNPPEGLREESVSRVRAGTETAPARIRRTQGSARGERLRLDLVELRLGDRARVEERLGRGDLGWVALAPEEPPAPALMYSACRCWSSCWASYPRCCIP